MRNKCLRACQNNVHYQRIEYHQNHLPLNSFQTPHSVGLYLKWLSNTALSEVKNAQKISISKPSKNELHKNQFL